MDTGKKLLVFLSALLALTGTACSANEAPRGGPPGGCVGKCDGDNQGGFEHRWAIDMAKVKQVSTYSRGVTNFTAVSPEQLLPPGAAAMGGHPELEQPLANFRERICSPEKIVGEGGAVSDGACLVWGNQQFRNRDHSAHVDDPANHPIVNYINEAGDKVDPPGYLNVIALLNAERHQQDEIRRYLKNGDILVYFHPEDRDTTQFQMHHAAMFYDTAQGPLAISLNGVPFVHHIDNPDSYGPTFNAGPTSTPFHVYRFAPNGQANTGGRNGSGLREFPCTDAIRDASGPEACQEGAATFTISDEMATQYAYVARNWAILTNNVSPFADFHTLTLQTVDTIDEFARPALERRDIPKLYCAGLAFTNLNLAINRPLNARALGSMAGTFDAINVNFDDRYLKIGPGGAHATLTAADLADTMDLPRMGQLMFEPITASDIIDAWVDGYYPNLNAQERAIVLQLAAPQVISGFRSLVWAATKDVQDVPSTVATPENFQRYVMAYAQRDVNPAAFEEFKQLERENVANRYVPPLIYNLEASKESSVLSYIGTVVHVDMLSPIGTNNGNTGTGEILEFFEGGPDTSQYPHFTVANGGRHAQRIFNVASGPEQVGYGSKVAVRVSASDINDVRGILHVPGTFTPLASYYDCDRNPDCLGTGATGIPIPFSPAQNGGQVSWNDFSVTFELFKPRSEGGLGCTVETDGRRLCPAYDELNDTIIERAIEIPSSRGQWTVTILDRGQQTTGADVQYCVACPTGGAHSNQWVLSIRDDAAPTGGGGTPPPPNVEQLLQESGSLTDGQVVTFTVTPPRGARRIRADLAVDSGGDADMYVRQGSAPTVDDYDCRPYAGDGEAEACTTESPTGTIHIMVRGYTASSFRLSVIAER